MAIWDVLETALHMSREDITPKMIGCTVDGASVNQGAKGGVVRKLQDEIGHTFVSLWWAPHKLELSLLDTTKAKHNKTMVEIVESGVDPIDRFYHGSAKRRRQLNEIAEVLEEDPVYFSGPCGSRWMVSRLRAYSAVKKHFPSVIMHLEDASHRKGEDGAKCVGYLRILKNRRFLEALSFLIDVLQILTDLSLTLQRDDILVTEVTIELNVDLLKLTALKNQKCITYRGLQNDIAHNVYCNITLTGNSLSEEMMHSFLDDCTHFMEHRFAHLKATPFSEFSIFDVGHHPHTLGDLADYGNDELLCLVQHFASVLSDDESERIVEEWTSLKAEMMARRQQKPADLIYQLLRENRTSLQNVLLLMRIMVNLSPSSAAVERDFHKWKPLRPLARQGWQMPPSPV